MNVSNGGIFIRSRRLSNTLVLLGLVSSIFCYRAARDPQLVVNSRLSTNPLLKELVAANGCSLQVLLVRSCGVLSCGIALQIFHRSANALTSFRSESHWRCGVGCCRECSLADKLSQELKLFKIPNTPGADHQVQFQLQMFQDTEAPIKRLRYQRNHFPAGLERTQEPSPDR